MKVPKYAQKMMICASFEFDHPKANPGYTMRIPKATPYTKADTLRAECEKLVAWARKNGSEAEILEMPNATHYCNQTAVVTITDPCMKYLEVFMLQDTVEK